MKFTGESEQKNTLYFLDVMVVRTGNHFSNTVFRKHINPLLFARWDSSNPKRYKINLIKAMLIRVCRITSRNFLDLELKILKDIFLRTGYPLRVLDATFARFFRDYTGLSEISDLPSEDFLFWEWISERILCTFREKY